ncbi:hypothetical protein AA0120_g91 [Alternaria tenuissima]|nr:hypothetical protein AA0120_g91 [Alternaria tenuissima]RYO56178.1 hypothetical protein AA0116_g8490 [Alternaria tenuissima]
MESSPKGKGKMRANVTEFFIVCGGSDPKEDVWQFADFFAIQREFTNNFGFKGTAWNMFPYEEYFAKYSTGKHKDEVWFGHGSTGFRVDPTFRFSKGDKTSWEDFSKDKVTNMDKKILQHINQQKLKPGDRFNFIFIGHGCPNGDFEVGNQRLSRKDLEESFARFTLDFQVNIIVASCWSGQLVDQMRKLGRRHQYVQSSTTADRLSWSYGRRVPSDPLRGSPFIASIVKSMGDREGANGKAPRTLGEHIEHVRKHGIWIREPDSIPQAYTNVDLHVAVITTLYSSYVRLEPGLAGPSKRTLVVNPGYPAPSSTFGPHFQHDAVPAAAKKAYEIIKREMALVKYNSNPGHPRDNGFGTLMQVAISNSKSMGERVLNIRIMMDALKWRFQMQERIIYVWQELENYDILSPECIMRRMELERTMSFQPVRVLSTALEFFEYAQDFGSAGRRNTKETESMRGHFEEPLYWLAILLMRGRTDNIPGVFGWLKSTGLLGGIAEDAQVPVSDLEGIGNQDQSPYLLCPEKSANADMSNCRIGFILPHGEEIMTWARKTSLRYTALRNAYLELNGPGTWDLDMDFIEELKELTQFVPSEYETVLKSQAEEMQDMSLR